jgi:hypothetical protein
MSLSRRSVGALALRCTLRQGCSRVQRTYRNEGRGTYHPCNLYYVPPFRVLLNNTTLSITRIPTALHQVLILRKPEYKLSID